MDSHAEGHESSRPPEQLRHAIHNGHHGIVATLEDLAVVHEEGIGDGSEANRGSTVIDGDGLFAQGLALGHHERFHARVREEQVLKRRIGQKTPSQGMPGATASVCRCRLFYERERWAAPRW